MPWASQSGLRAVDAAASGAITVVNATTTRASSPPQEVPPPTSPPVFGGATNPPATPTPPTSNGGWQPGQGQWGNGNGQGQWGGGAPSPPSPVPPPSNNGGGWQQGQGQWGSPTTPPAPVNRDSTTTPNDGWRPGQSQWGNQDAEQPRPTTPPVQGGGRNDTLDTRAQQTATSNQLGAPRLLAPTNPRELAPTIPLEWSSVSGATHYELAVRDLTTNAFVVDQPVYNTVFHRAPYTSGRTFRWTVRARPKWVFRLVRRMEADFDCFGNS